MGSGKEIRGSVRVVLAKKIGLELVSSASAISHLAERSVLVNQEVTGRIMAMANMRT
jgi:hypothetical protein